MHPSERQDIDGPAAITGLNHVTLAVRDLRKSLAFYQDMLGLRVRALSADAAYLEAGDLWLCLSQDPLARATPHPDYSHFAFSVAPGDYAALEEAIRRSAPLWRENRSEGDSVYFLDPDGHKLELHVGSLESRLNHYREHPEKGVSVFD